MTGRLLTASAITEALAIPIPAGVQIEAGTPEAAYTELQDQDGISVGVWAMTPGTAVDVEQAEVFVVVEGVGQLRFEGGATVALRAGTVVRLQAGDRVTWQISETVRKVYFAWTQDRTP